ncbi:MAG TPA: Hsp20/alpha crystallin family protein [Candidatus Binataceae bacterium]|nr:Hsp20/alpha crystallin family protein [Candidatus Binataceae bacterium]
MARDIQAWSPFRELDHFRRNFDDMFDRLLGGWAPEAIRREANAPAIESYVENGNIVIRADLPGVDPKDVEITVNDDILTVRGKRESSKEEKGKNYIHREVAYGSFERSMRLPKGIDANSVKANYNNGVLEVRVQAPKEMAPRKVPIAVEVPKEEKPKTA